MAQERYPHLFIENPSQTLSFTNPQRGGKEPRIPHRERIVHSARLQGQFDAAWQENDAQRAIVQTERHGIYLEFSGEPGYDLITKSLEDSRSGIRLLNIRKSGDEENEKTLATVYIPLQSRKSFLKKLQDYETKTTANGKPKNQDLVNSISDIRSAILRSFWVDQERLTPANDRIWVEVWLSSRSDQAVQHFIDLLQQNEIENIRGHLSFPERSVLLINANCQDLEFLIQNSDDIAELRSAAKVSSFFLELSPEEQADWVNELLSRTQYPNETPVAVTILDSGVNAGHALIRPVLAEEDQHTWDATWGIGDDPKNGHGTLMAGTIIYGDLAEALQSDEICFVPHLIESVKILPHKPEQNPKCFWGLITEQGLQLVESQAPDRHRIICMAVSAPEDLDRGRPSSWSAAIDALAAGCDNNRKRLFILSAGNVQEYKDYLAYPGSNMTASVHNPGQSWNALTIGAYTNKTQIDDFSLRGYQPISEAGGLAPSSTTSLVWPKRKWPIKPDVLMEGGNAARGPNDSIQLADELMLISTYHDPQTAQFAPFGETSAAAAQAAWMAAQIQAKYPQAWPETIRALLVHSAEWTEVMKHQFLPPDPHKDDYATLLRICGYGVPDLERALYCAANNLTLIAQNELQPYAIRNGRAVTNDMHYYRLPWPNEILRDMGEAQIMMRVTLSYFIEPGPGEVGWQDRYRYPSHLLRFEMNGPSESESEFKARINYQARDEGAPPGTHGPRDRWLVGDARHLGSIHSDIWQGPAVELANSNLIGVYPAVGWWRERKHLKNVEKQARYALLISVRTQALAVDIYTPVAAQIQIPTPIVIPTQ